MHKSQKQPLRKINVAEMSRVNIRFKLTPFTLTSLFGEMEIDTRVR